MVDEQINEEDKVSGKIKDFLSATGQEGVSTFLESGSLKSLIAELITKIGSDATLAGLLSGIFAAVAPRVNGVILNYKQNRYMRNMMEFVKALIDDLDSLKVNFSALENEMQERFKTIGAEMLLDNIVDERQRCKVKWNVKGYIALMNNESNENIMQIFFDTLADVTELDVDVLKMYNVVISYSYQDIEDKYHIGPERIKLVKEKLVRLGLLDSKNDEIRDTNLDNIVRYLEDVEKESKKKNPKSVKLPSKIKKVSSSEYYKLSRLGRGFLQAIGEEGNYRSSSVNE